MSIFASIAVHHQCVCTKWRAATTALETAIFGNTDRSLSRTATLPWGGNGCDVGKYTTRHAFHSCFRLLKDGKSFRPQKLDARNPTAQRRQSVCMQIYPTGCWLLQQDTVAGLWLAGGGHSFPHVGNGRMEVQARTAGHKVTDYLFTFKFRQLPSSSSEAQNRRELQWRHDREWPHSTLYNEDKNWINCTDAGGLR